MRCRGKAFTESQCVNGRSSDMSLGHSEGRSVLASGHSFTASRHWVIRDGATGLKDAFKWSLIPEGEGQDAARAVLPQQWFLDRVFDKYLWAIGADDEARVGGFV
jgi:hypothetical protein